MREHTPRQHVWLVYREGTSESALHLFLFQTGDRFQRTLEVLNSF